MYRVIEMYGDFEPWWFLEGWEEDIVASKKFDQYYDALKYYKTCWFRLEQESPLYKSRSDLMTIFWDPADQRWCDSVMSIYNNTILWLFCRMSRLSQMKNYAQAMKNKLVRKGTVLAV